MIKHLLFAFVLLVGALVCRAEQLTENDAILVAQKFVKSEVVTKKTRAFSKPALKLAYIAKGKTSKATYFAFNRGSNGGYVLVAGDDRAVPVLGYSDSGKFDYSVIPENMKWWLDQYTQEIEYIQSQPEITSTLKATKLTKSVAPLLGDTQWDQNAPYNNLCPTYKSDTTTYRSATGCVATAMSQIMYYHKCPVTGSGSNSYSVGVNGSATKTTLSVDFSKSTYDWANMKPTYGSASSDVSKAAVAKLMYDCGVSVNMQYGASSGASTIRAIGALANNFVYDKGITYLSRSVYSIPKWEEIIRTELDASRPVLYSGRNESSGHAFVFDGYNTDGYFHVNWGWSGYSNGYYVTTALNPGIQGNGGSSSGYNMNQGIIIGIKKDAGGTASAHVYTDSQMTPSVTEVALGTQFQLNISSFSAVYPAKSVSVYGGYNIYNSKDELVKGTLTQLGALNVGNSYSFGLNCTIPTTFAEDTYKIKMTYSTDGKTVNLVDVPFSQPQYIQMVVKNGMATLTNPTPTAVLAKSNFALVGTKVYSQKMFSLKSIVSNTGDEYYGNIYFGLFSSDSTLKSVSEPILVDLAQGQSVNLDATMTAAVDAGNYYLEVLDGSKSVIAGSRLDVAVEAAPADPQLVMVAQLEPTQLCYDQLKAHASIKNNGGYFGGNIEMMVLSASTGGVLQIINSEFVTLEQDETKDVNFSGQFYSGQIGNSYRLALRDPNEATDYYIWSNPVSFTLDVSVGVNEISKTSVTRIYPNPVDDIVTVESPSEIKHINVYSVLGVNVLNVAVASQNISQINVSGLIPGQYIMQIENEEGITTKTMIKK